VYQFKGGDVVMNGCGAENCYGNGFVGFEKDQGGTVTVNNGATFGSTAGVISEYVPALSLGSGYAVGAFQTSNGPCVLNINGGRYSYINNAAPVVADLVAYNYDEGAYGDRNTTMVSINGVLIPSELSRPFAGRGNWFKYCRNSVNTGNTFHVKAVGTGSKITLPVTPQSGTPRRHLIRLLGINTDGSGVGVNAVEASIGFTSQMTTSNLSFWNTSNVANVLPVGGTIEITLLAPMTDPEFTIDFLSTNGKLLDLNGITIS
jgi:hypothetical protein